MWYYIEIALLLAATILLVQDLFLVLRSRGSKLELLRCVIGVLTAGCYILNAWGIWGRIFPTAPLTLLYLTIALSQRARYGSSNKKQAGPDSPHNF
jgi:hypothetical protein